MHCQRSGVVDLRFALPGELPGLNADGWDRVKDGGDKADVRWMMNDKPSSTALNGHLTCGRELNSVGTTMVMVVDNPDQSDPIITYARLNSLENRSINKYVNCHLESRHIPPP